MFYPVEAMHKDCPPCLLWPPIDDSQTLSVCFVKGMHRRPIAMLVNGRLVCAPFVRERIPAWKVWMSGGDLGKFLTIQMAKGIVGTSIGWGESSKQGCPHCLLLEGWSIPHQLIRTFH